MKKAILLSAIGLAGIGLFVAMILSAGPTTLWRSLQTVSPAALLLFTALSVINFLLFTLRWDIIIRTADPYHKQSLFKLALFRFVTYTVSYLIPSAQVGGEPARMYLLEKTGVSKTTAVSSVILDKVFEIAAMILFTIITFVILVWQHKQVGIEGIAIIGVIVGLLFFFFYQTVWGTGFFTFLFSVLRLNRFKTLARFQTSIAQTEDTMKQFFNHHSVALFATIIVSLICFVLIIVEYAVIFYFLDVHPTLLQLLIVTIIPLMSYVIPIPGSVGTLEVAHVAAFSLAGLDPVLALPTIIILRIRDIFFVFIGLVYSYKVGFSLIQKKKL